MTRTATPGGGTFDAETVRRLAGLSGLALDPDHVPGGVAALDTLMGQAAILFDPAIDPLVEPAPVFRA